VATPALVAGLLAALILSGCGGGESGQATAEPRPKSVPPLYHQAHYDVTIFNGWPQDASDRRTGSYLESAWHDPVSSRITFLVDSGATADTGTPIANAELARRQAEQSSDYRERGFKKIMLGGHPAIRWAFDLSGEGRVDYFFAECGTGIRVRGSTLPVSFEALAESFQTMASTIKVVCNE
jgi:hypothetical protein